LDVVMRFARNLQIVPLEIAASSLLLGIAWLWGALRGIDLAGAARPSLPPLAVGVLAGLAMATALPLVTAPWARRVLVLRGLRRAWNSLESGLAPGLGWWDVIVLAVCSGISEEAFFRGILQQEVGLVASSVVFGLFHPLGIAYVVWAAAAGAGFGALYSVTGSLIAPAAAHGVYNLVALTYLRHCSARQGELS
jgi:hypothetical protein